ncbi:ATP-binding cassette domain-containing protein, partial [Serratia marcescens]
MAAAGAVADETAAAEAAGGGYSRGQGGTGMSVQPLLQVEGLSMRFGGLLAVNNVALTLNEGEIVSLIGPNGAGKTTVFNCL